MNGNAAPSRKTILPPPDLRSNTAWSFFGIFNLIFLLAIIDKTASFVAKNGKEFEERILENERNNSKFAFLAINDPYRPYYEIKVMDYKLGREDSFASTVPTQAKVDPTTTVVDEPESIPSEPTPLAFLLDLPVMSNLDL